MLKQRVAEIMAAMEPYRDLIETAGIRYEPPDRSPRGIRYAGALLRPKFYVYDKKDKCFLVLYEDDITIKQNPFDPMEHLVSATVQKCMRPIGRVQLMLTSDAGIEFAVESDPMKDRHVRGDDLQIRFKVTIGNV